MADILLRRRPSSASLHPQPLNIQKENVPGLPSSPILSNRRRVPWNHKHSSDSITITHSSACYAESLLDPNEVEVSTTDEEAVPDLHPLRLNPPNLRARSPLSRIAHGELESLDANAVLVHSNSFRSSSYHGLQLESILERDSRSTLLDDASLATSSSISTLPQARPASNLARAVTVSHPHEVPSVSKVPSGLRVSGDKQVDYFSRRRKGFSESDIQQIKNAYHSALSSINNHPKRNLYFSHDTEFAKPHEALYSPLNRPCTPDGMPSWDVAQEAYRTGTQPMAHAQTGAGATSRWDWLPMILRRTDPNAQSQLQASLPGSRAADLIWDNHWHVYRPRNTNIDRPQVAPVDGVIRPPRHFRGVRNTHLYVPGEHPFFWGQIDNMSRQVQGIDEKRGALLAPEPQPAPAAWP